MKKPKPKISAHPKDIRKILLTVLASTLVLQLFAQNSDSTNMVSRRNRQNSKRDRMNNLLRMEEEGDLIFNKHNIFGIRLASDGYGINFEKGKFKSPRRTLLFQFELNEKKDPKEHHISATSDGINFSSVVPYKLNNLYEFKMAIGEERLLGGKGNRNGVAVTYLYSFGGTLGMLKPYYLDVQNQVTGASFRKTYDQMVADTASGDVITGASGFTVGWGNLTIKPAVNARQAMRFDYGRLNQSVAAIEVGLTEEFYFSKIPLVYLVNQRRFFFNAYVAILFGNRK
ncbi:MAG TPA: hypothetical protein VHE34_13345 [Puia sp.]|uniref:hypothetical protein n=1 Tax=Puia sp. TaxID=2045100 RepID=UPI002BAD3C70|nr:hypothetical protein [Puia sp.]HVU96207.1 hypothetical protein [Puia sp.]